MSALPELELRDLRKSFGGIAAVDGVSIRFPPGRITGLVGPNGAGKTTIFNLITGAVSPSGGAVMLGGEAITGLRPHRVARRGIGRTFQQVRIFPELSVLQNASLGLPDVSDSLLRSLFLTRVRQRGIEARARESLSFFRLEGRAAEPAASLSYAEQKLLMFACLLGLGATTLLLDEPTAGLDPSSRGPVLDAIAHLSTLGRTIVLVEHNLDVVRNCCEQAVFLAEGRVVRTGTPAELEADADLAALYFGTKARTHA